MDRRALPKHDTGIRLAPERSSPRQIAHHGHLTNRAMPENAVIISPLFHHGMGHDRFARAVERVPKPKAADSDHAAKSACFRPADFINRN